jgi:dihydropteroate synthase
MIAKLVSLQDFETELNKTGIDDRSQALFSRKKETVLIRLFSIDAKAANILKQVFLSSGGDVAVHKEVASFSCQFSDALCMGTQKNFEEVIDKISMQNYFGLNKIGFDLKGILQKINRKHKKQIMGIVNITPDSFSDGGIFFSQQDATARIRQMILDGADIIDIGGESSRPGAIETSLEEEIKRVIPVIELTKEINKEVKISIDTTKQKVAEEAYKKGVSLINTIFLTEEMLGWLSTNQVPFVVMHMRGSPQNMQSYTKYNDVVDEILQFFDQKLQEIQNRGIDTNRIIIDPGIGFAKTPEQNMQILHHLSCFQIFGLPVMLGISRKSFMGKIWNIPLEERDLPTQLLSIFGFMNGASLLRVHDTKNNVLAKTIFESIAQSV